MKSLLTQLPATTGEYTCEVRRSSMKWKQGAHSSTSVYFVTHDEEDSASVVTRVVNTEIDVEASVN